MSSTVLESSEFKPRVLKLTKLPTVDLRKINQFNNVKVINNG